MSNIARSTNGHVTEFVEIFCFLDDFFVNWLGATTSRTSRHVGVGLMSILHEAAAELRVVGHEKPNQAGVILPRLSDS